MIAAAIICFAIAAVLIAVLAVSGRRMPAPVPAHPLSWSYDGITWNQGVLSDGL